MEREASKLFPWRCNVCAQTEFLDKTGRYKTEGNLGDILDGNERSIENSILYPAVGRAKAAYEEELVDEEDSDVEMWTGMGNFDFDCGDGDDSTSL